MKLLCGLALSLCLVGATAASAQNYNRDHQDEQQNYNRGGDHHEWDRGTFDREYGQHGASWDRQWRRGERLPDGYATDQRYVVRDYGHHRLSRPARGYHWVRYGNGYVQARDNGYVARGIYGTRY